MYYKIALNQSKSNTGKTLPVILLENWTDAFTRGVLFSWSDEFDFFIKNSLLSILASGVFIALVSRMSIKPLIMSSLRVGRHLDAITYISANFRILSIFVLIIDK
jgi:hypothetical protein